MSLDPKLSELTTAGGFRAAVAGVLADLAEHDPKINEGLRTLERQRELVRLGRSKTLRSKHLPGPDGLARAADIVPRRLGWSAPRSYWMALGRAALARGLGWGGLFGLTAAQKATLERDLREGRLGTSARMGWDPAHVEVR